jgi:hypothetical protein
MRQLEPRILNSELRTARGKQLTLASQSSIQMTTWQFLRLRWTKGQAPTDCLSCDMLKNDSLRFTRRTPSPASNPKGWYHLYSSFNHPLSSTEIGVWSEGFSSARGPLSISHRSSLAAAPGDSRKWSMRIPRLYSKARRK